MKSYFTVLFILILFLSAHCQQPCTLEENKVREFYEFLPKNKNNLHEKTDYDINKFYIPSGYKVVIYNPYSKRLEFKLSYSNTSWNNRIYTLKAHKSQSYLLRYKNTFTSSYIIREQVYLKFCNSCRTFPLLGGTRYKIGWSEVSEEWIIYQP